MCWICNLFLILLWHTHPLNTGPPEGSPRGGGQKEKGRRQNWKAAGCQQRRHRNRGAHAHSISIIRPSELFRRLLFFFFFLFLNHFCCFTFSFVWQETILREQVEGLIEEDEEEEESAPNEDGEDVAVGGITLSDKKTERQRKKEKAEKMKVSWCLFFSPTQHDEYFHKGIVSSDNPNICHSLHIPGAAAAGRQTADWPAAAALPAPLHKVHHQTAGGGNQQSTEDTESQSGGAEGAAEAPRQTQVRPSGSSFLKWHSARHVFFVFCVYFTKVKKYFHWNAFIGFFSVLIKQHHHTFQCFHCYNILWLFLFRSFFF